MAQQHMDRLSGADAMFLAYEDAARYVYPMFGAVLVFDGPPPTLARIGERMGARLHREPRFRQRIHHVRYAGRPFWIDDERFDVDRHLHRKVLREGSRKEELLGFAARLFELPLQRGQPLWELWLIEGFDSTGFAIVPKIHHAVCDGQSFMRLLASLFLDLDRAGPSEVEQPWSPQPVPSRMKVFARGLHDVARLATGGSNDPRYSLHKAWRALRPQGRAFVSPAPLEAIRGRVGPHRELAVAHVSLDDVATVREQFGGTVNDVFLTGVAGGLRRWAGARGAADRGELHVAVPVNLRRSSERDALGNRISALRVRLPIREPDPRHRYTLVSREMQQLKLDEVVAGSTLVLRLNDLLPVSALRTAARMNFLPGLFGLVTSNVIAPPGLYLDGQPLRAEIVPITWLPEQHLITITAVGYDGLLSWGVLGDASLGVGATRDIAEAIRAEIEALT